MPASSFRRIGRTARRVQRASWRVSSAAGDISAATQGPAALGRRLARKKIYRVEGSLTRKLLRRLGL